ncbi:MAG: hypothetical protein WBA13_00400 [Microcoleaceae cyanobacterium]
MKTCLCCREKLLHHISQNRCYWFCSYCRQAMPATDERKIISSNLQSISSLSDSV